MVVVLFLLIFPPIFYTQIFLPCWDCFDFEAAIAHEAGHAEHAQLQPTAVTPARTPPLLRSSHGVRGPRGGAGTSWASTILTRRRSRTSSRPQT